MNGILSPARKSASPTYSGSSHNPTLTPEQWQQQKISRNKAGNGAAVPAFRPDAAPKPDRGEAGSSGLVYTQTSGTRQSPILIDTALTRVKRMKSSVITAARLLSDHQEKGFRKERAAFITLTYRIDAIWQPNHSSMLIRHLRQWFKRRGHKMRFVWVMELHKDGRPHYHALVWLPRGLTLPKPDKQGWWPHGSTKIETARNPVGYIAKYASKGEFGGFTFPYGARIHGCGGLEGVKLLEARWWKLPSWVREVTLPHDMPRRNKGGGILLPDTGEILESPWTVSFNGGRVYIWRDYLPSSECV